MAGKECSYHGIVTIYKEAGFTSFDVVAKLRGIFGQRKIGHTGTLDPDATGVLPVCLGNATKVCDLLADGEKEYVAELLLGIRTDTQDTSGMLVNQDWADDFARAKEVSEEQICEAISSFLGDYEQIPPMYSAKKINGQKLYDLARKGIEVERKPCHVHISEIEVLSIGKAGDAIAKGLVGPMILPKGKNEDEVESDYEETAEVHSGFKTEVNAAKEKTLLSLTGYENLPVIRMRVVCSKGTYIRTLCDDIGNLLGCGGCMRSLLRTQVGPFDLQHALTLSQVQAVKEEGKLQELLQSVDSLFPDYAEAVILPEFTKWLENGNKLEAHMVKIRNQGLDQSNQVSPIKQQLFRVYFADGSFAGIYEMQPHQILKPVKLFFSR